MIADLRELQALTSDEKGAQRICWSAQWRAGRNWLRDKLENLPVQVRKDAAGNLWATLPGTSPRTLVIGSHLDSVPNGGWLDGCLGVIAGLEVLRYFSTQAPLPFSVCLVDWAEEEGARFGNSVFGSSAVSGSLDINVIKDLRDKDGRALPDVLLENGVILQDAPQAQCELENVSAYLELHIEQGPVLESMGLPLGAVLGATGIERGIMRFVGQAAHAGATPMHLRRDAFLAGARWALAVRENAIALKGVATTGKASNTPGIFAAVAGESQISLDQRHLDIETLAAMLEFAKSAAAEIAAQEKVSWEYTSVFRCKPVRFHPQLMALCEQAIVETCGVSHQLPSGPIHDACEISRTGVPTAMLFVQSLRGLSHCKEEDTHETDLVLAVQALARWAEKTLAWMQTETGVA